MTVGDLLDQVARNADDNTGAFRSAARRWLNLTRSYISDGARWKDAVTANATFDTAAATTSGLYTLDGYEHIVSDWMFDKTNKATIRQESYGTLRAADQALETTGQPTWWADAGVDSSDNRQIYLWPIPDDTFTIEFSGYAVLSDIGDNDDNLDTDPFFGKITPWFSTFEAGVRYFHDQDTNEDVQQIALQKAEFDRRIRRRAKTNQLAPASRLRLAEVRGRGQLATGRFDPAHFSNR